ncbi:MAG: class I SAM-dependent methyltransferase [Candidatus Asgardarchaeia archaeon]
MAKPRNKRYEYILKHLLRYGVNAGSKVIDCACGDGYGSHILSSADLDVTGYDISKGCVSAAVERGVTAAISSICDLPCDDCYADVFICSETLEHLDDKDILKAVDEIRRVVKINGIICITVPENKKLCLRNKHHKQYIPIEQLRHLFRYDNLIFCGKFCKTPSKCNIVMLFRKDID